MTSSVSPETSTADAANESWMPRRTLLGQALYDTFGQAGARLGLGWIAFLTVIAVGAPFLASSHPLIYREHGSSTEYPIFRYLTAVDVVLVILLFNLAVVICRKLGAGMCIALASWPALLALVVAAILRLTPPLVRFQLYRPKGGTPTEWIGAVLVHFVAAVALIAVLLLLFLATKAMLRAVAGFPKTLTWVAFSGVLASGAVVLIDPPTNPPFSRYREAKNEGRVDLMVSTLVPFSPNDRRMDVGGTALLPPSGTHWFGTTVYGDDLLTQIIHSTRVALAIGLIATSISTVIGIIIGGLLGYYGGLLDMLGMRVLEIIESIPTLVLLLIITVFFGRSLYLMMAVIGLVSWTSDARFIRAEFFRLRNLDFVHAAVAAGLSRRSIIFRHMLPNGVSPVLVNASFGIAGAILLESSLSFLGLGLGAEDPSWGQLLEQVQSNGGGFKWWLAVYPGLAMFLTVFSYILIGESMRDALDPKLKKAH